MAQPQRKQTIFLNHVDLSVIELQALKNKKQNKKKSSNGRDDLAKIKKEVTYEWLNERMNE